MTIFVKVTGLHKHDLKCEFELHTVSRKEEEKNLFSWEKKSTISNKKVLVFGIRFRCD